MTVLHKTVQQTEEMKQHLHYQKCQEELLTKKETRGELKEIRLKVSFHEIQERYETELTAERQKNETIQQEFKNQETIQRLKAEQDAFKQKM